VTVSMKKVEVTLEKAVEGTQWRGLRVSDCVPSRPATSGQSTSAGVTQYPSSSCRRHDWDRVDKEIQKELSKEKPEGDEALNELFREIYSKGDEDTRRAMIKSFQTSGGTVLSTNWDEVRRENYDKGIKPPSGQEVRRWEQ